MIALQLNEASAALVVEALGRLLAVKRQAHNSFRYASQTFSERDFGIPQIEALITSIEEADEIEGQGLHRHG
jgi:hypothetical protein